MNHRHIDVNEREDSEREAAENLAIARSNPANRIAQGQELDDDYTPGMGYYMGDGEYTKEKFW